MDNIPAIVWLILLLAFAALEGVTVGLTSIWFAAGALAALIAALLHGPLWLQIALFLVVSILCLLAVRPLARKYINTQVQPTNADRVIGAEGMVLEDINNLKARGQVKVQGNIWTARTEDDRPIPKDTTVRVLRIEGVKLIVAPLQEAGKGGI